MQNKILKIILTFICVVLLGVGIMLTVTTEVPVTAKELPNGYEITGADIKTKRILKSQITDDTYIDSFLVINKQTNTHLNSGSFFTKTNVSEKVKAQVGDSSDAIITIPLAVDSAHVPDLLKKGDIVNLLFYFSSDSVEQNGEAFAIGFNYIATVSSVQYNEKNEINKVDVLINKNIAVDVAASTSLGQLFIVKNDDLNDVELKGVSASDLLSKYYLQEIQLIEEEVAEQKENAEIISEDKQDSKDNKEDKGVKDE